MSSLAQNGRLQEMDRWVSTLMVSDFRLVDHGLWTRLIANFASVKGVHSYSKVLLYKKINSVYALAEACRENG